MTASTWSRRVTGTDCAWDNTMGLQETPCHGTTIRPSPLWIETRTAILVCSPPAPVSSVCWLSLCTNKLCCSFGCVLRKLCSLPERRLVVPHVCPLQPKWCVVSGGTLSQPLPGWGLLGRIPWGGLLPQTSFHDD